MARPSEIKAVRHFLEHGIDLEQKADESDDAYRERYLQEGAKAIINTLDDSRVDRTDYVVIAQAGRMVQGYGLFATYNQAAKAITNQQLRGVDGTRFFVVPVMHPKAHAARIAEADAPALSEAAQQSWHIARNGGQPARTHSRRNRRRAS